MAFNPTKKAAQPPSQGNYSPQLTEYHFVTKNRKPDAQHGLAQGEGVVFQLLSYDTDDSQTPREAFRVFGRKCAVQMGTELYEDIPVWVPEDHDKLAEANIVDDANTPLVECKATSSYLVPVLVRAIVNWKTMDVIESFSDYGSLMYIQLTAGQWNEINEIFNNIQEDTALAEPGTLPPYSLMLVNRSKADKGQDISPYKIMAVKKMKNPETKKLETDSFWNVPVEEFDEDLIEYIQEEWDALLADMAKGYEKLTSLESVMNTFAHYKKRKVASTTEETQDTPKRGRVAKVASTSKQAQEEEEEPDLNPDRVVASDEDEVAEEVEEKPKTSGRMVNKFRRNG